MSLGNKPSIEYALELLTSQFDGRPNIIRFIESILKPLAQQNQDIDALKDLRNLETAEGRQLDLIGMQLGLSRRGFVDAQYRVQLILQIFLNTTDGTRGFIIEAVRQLTAATTVIYHDLKPAAFSIFTDGPNTFNIFGAEVVTSTLTLNGDTLLLNGDTFQVTTSDTEVVGIESTLAAIKPAGVGFIPVTTSLGTPTEEVYGFNDDSYQFASLLTNTGDTLTLNGAVFTTETRASAISAPYFFQGFGEVGVNVQLITNTGDSLLLNGDNFFINDLRLIDGGGIIPEVVIA